MYTSVIMKRKILSQLLLGLLLVLTMEKPSIASINSEAGMSYQELVVALASENPETATNALEEIFKVGDRMIPMIISLQGNQKMYWGYKLGHPNSADLLYLPDKVGLAKTHVSLEVVALYLLEAIFRNDLSFAQSPFLVGRYKRSKPPLLNTDDNIHRSWISVNKWMSLLKTKGIDYLRKKNINPLFKSKTHFWGS